MKLKLKKSNEEKVLLLYRRACACYHEKPALKSMRGNTSSKVLLIAPPPTETELAQGVPLSDEASHAFHFALLNVAGFDTERDSLVISCAFSPSGKKQSTEPIANFVGDTAEAGLFSRYVVVGAQAFKQLFGDGKSPTMTTLSGSTLYLPRLNGVPLFVFPDIASLVVPQGTVFKTRRDESVAFRVAEELQNKLANQIIPKFKNFLK